MSILKGTERMRWTLHRAVTVTAMLVAASWPLAATCGPVEDTREADEAYRNGDVASAMSKYRRAADAGHAPAQVGLARLLDASEDDKSAFDLYRKAADQNYAAGIHGVGLMYAKGEGTPRDPAEALKWYRRAADMDFLPSVEAIAWAYLVGDLGLAPDKAAADSWGERVVKLGGKRPAVKPPPTKSASPKPAPK
jgi:TPR repeat protein